MTSAYPTPMIAYLAQTASACNNPVCSSLFTAFARNGPTIFSSTLLVYSIALTETAFNLLMV